MANHHPLAVLPPVAALFVAAVVRTVVPPYLVAAVAPLHLEPPNVPKGLFFRRVLR